MNRMDRNNRTGWWPVLILLATLGAAWPGRAGAQMSYTRTGFSGSYTAISTGGGATALTFSSTDDGTTSIALPFAFTYAGTNYTTANYLAVCTNGEAFFSTTSVTTPSSAANTNLYTTSTPNSTLAPWWDDLNVGAVGTNPAGQVLYQTQGTAGSRTLTVQWTNVSSYFSTTSGQPRVINFQVILYEGTNVIEFQYGSTSGTTLNTAESASIGIEDGTGGNNHYIDAITGSGQTSNGMLNSGKWPTLFYRFTPGAPGALAGGSYTVGSGGAYPSLTEAVADLNHRGVAGAVTLSLTDATYDSTKNAFPILIGPVAGVSAANTVTIQPASGTATLSYRGSPSGNAGNAASTTAIGTTNEPILGLVGADYVTVRNLNLATLGNNLVDRGLYVINSSATDGAQNDTFEGLAVTLARTNTGTVGVQQNVITTPTAAGGANSGNRYYNFTVANCYAGAQLTGNSTYPDQLTEFGVSGGGSTTIGGAGANDIGNGTAETWGLRATSQAGLKVFGCEVRNVTGTSTSAVSGIWLENTGSTTTSVGTCEVYNNRVHDLNNTSTSAGVVRGLRINLTGNAASISRVYNNFVWGVQSASTVTTSRRIIGLSVQDAGSGSGATHNVDFNSVRIEPTNLSCSNSAFEIGTTSGPVMNVRNNVFGNFSGAQSGSAKHYCWVTTSGTLTGAAGSVSNRNVLHVASATNGYVGLTNATDQATLAAWQAAVSQDANSLTANPQYQATTNLHINAANPTPVESGGSYFAGAITWAASDIDGEARNATTPDIGADEGAFTQLLNNDMQTTALVDPANGGARVGGVAFSPQATFANGGVVAQTNVKVKYRIEGPNPATTIVYSDSSLIASINPGISTTVTFAAATIGTSGTYTMYAWTELPGDQAPANDQLSGTFDVLAPLCGTYLVGTGQPAPFNTLTGAIARLNTVGVSCAVVFELTDAGYSAGETFPITINALPGASAASTFTLRPAPGVNAAISGSSTTAVIKLNGADYVTIDGSNNGSTSRNLTIANTSTLAATAGVWLSSLGAGAGCTYDTVKNCLINCGVDQSVGTNETIGILTSGAAVSTASDGAGNDNNTLDNNVVTKARWGIYLRGLVGTSNVGNAVTGNVVGPAAFGADEIGKGGVVVQLQDGAVISQNEVRFVGGTLALTTAGTDRVGIALGDPAWTPTGTATVNARVTRNSVHDIVDERTYSAVGILVGGTGAPSNNLVANNMVRDVRANGTSGDQAVGIGIGGPSSGDVVAFNSIHLSGDQDPGSSTTATQSGCGIRIASTSPANLTLKNNIISVDATSNTSTLKHYAIVAPATTYAWGTGGSDYNDYDVNPANTQMSLGGIGTTVPYTSVATLAAWKTQFTPAQDAGSYNVLPPFVSPADLHLATGTPTPLESGATPLAAVTDDFDGHARAATPDVGADEGAFTPLNANDISAKLLIDPANGGTKSTGVPFSPQASFENPGTANQVNVMVKYRITGPSPATTVVYEDSSVVAAFNAGTVQTVTFASCTLATGGSYAMTAWAVLPGDQNPVNDSLSGTFDVLAPLCGSYLVGTGQPAPFNTLTSAINRLNLVGVSCAVVFELTDALYASPAETFPITINAIPGASATSTFTLKPAPTVVPTISGSSATAVVVLNGCDWVTIDGSNNGSTSRDLTVTNTGTGTSSAVVWAQAAGGVDGVSSCAVRNVNVTGNAGTTTLVALGFGGTTIGVTSNGAGHNGNVVENCAVSKAQYGIYSAGASAVAKNSGNIIRRNDINTASPNNVSIGGILVRFEDGVQITGNQVGEMNRASGSDFGIGLGIGATTNLITSTTSDEVSNALVSGNRVAVVSSPSTTGYTAAGIQIGASATGTNVVINNMISGVTSPATPSDITVGIYLRSGPAGTDIWHNSVWLTGDRGVDAENPSFGLAINGTTPVADIRNNIFANIQTTAGTGVTYAVGVADTVYTGLVMNNNDLYAAGAASAFARTGGLGNLVGTDRTSLAAWQAATGLDLASISADPLFTGLNNLHIVTSPVSPVSNAGPPIAAVTTDFDGEARSATTPDIGADEFTAVSPATITIDDVTAAEGAYPNTTPFVFTVKLLPAQGDTVKVSWATSAGTATAGVDYVDVPAPLLLVFAPGDTQKTVTVTVIGDALIELDETVFVDLTNPVNATLGDNQGLGTILNDDDVSGIPDVGVPARTFLAPNFPNPFAAQTTVAFGIKEAGPVRLQVFDIRGRLVRTLFEGSADAGYLKATWDGQDDFGGRMASGFYVLRLEASGRQYTHNMRLVR